MMPYYAYQVGKYRMEAAQQDARTRRFKRSARIEAPHGDRPAAIDALGHGLIAIGTRLVSDRHAHPNHRRAA